MRAIGRILVVLVSSVVLAACGSSGGDPDTSAPVITLMGANPQVIEAGSAYVELGATARDNHDGDLSHAIVIDATQVNTAVPGSYSVTYSATDAAGNRGATTRTVVVEDTTPPVITLLGDDPQGIEAGSAYVELGATASDTLDGDLSTAIAIDASTVNTTVPGEYTVSYDVSDAAGNAAVTVTRTVLVRDTTPPVIALLGDDPQMIEAGSAYVELGAMAADTLDGSLNTAIIIDSSAVNTMVPGDYRVRYDVSDAAGNAAVTVTRTVLVRDTTPPVITLLGDDPQMIEAGSAYVELGATASDTLDGDLSTAVAIDASTVNTAVPGDYTVIYAVSDATGNAAVNVTRTVLVQDTTPPVITLLGDDPQVIEAGSDYVELGANASDSLDGDLKNSLAIDASQVDTYSPGSYVVTYTVSDAAGNTGTATRAVLIEDTTSPEITLLGDNPQVFVAGDAYIELGATASDIVDGDLTALISIDVSQVDTSSTRIFEVVYEVADSSGNLSIAERMVRVLATGQWRRTGYMNVSRSSHNSVLLPDGRVLVTGGPTELYDPQTGQFEVLTAISEQLFEEGHTTTVLADGRVLIAGGRSYYGSDKAYLVSLSPISISPVGPMKAKRTGHTATLLDDGRVLIIGGEGELSLPEDPFEVGSHASAEIFDPLSSTFSVTGPLNEARAGHTATLLHDGSVFVVAGYQYYKRILASTEIYDPDSGTFRTSARMPDDGRMEHTATLLPDGNVLVVGGHPQDPDTSREFYPKSVIFDVAAESFQITGEMVVPRGAHVAAMLHSSSSDCYAPVLIAGGNTGWKSDTSSVELFDPVLGEFYEMQRMEKPRGWPAGTVLADGRVLITGGVSYFDWDARGAEVFEVIGGCP